MDWLGTKLDGRLTLAECRTAGLALPAIQELGEQVKRDRAAKNKPYNGLRIRFVLERPAGQRFELPDMMWLEEASAIPSFKIIIEDSDGGAHQPTKPLVLA